MVARNNLSVDKSFVQPLGNYHQNERLPLHSYSSLDLLIWLRDMEVRVEHIKKISIFDRSYLGYISVQ